MTNCFHVMPTNNLLVLKNVIFCLAIAWTILIAFLCLVKFNNLPSISVSGADKYVHFTFHFVFTLLWGFYLFLNQHQLELKKIGILVFVSLCYGIVIEFMQELFTTTRHADVLDVLANLIGATIAFLLFVISKKIKSKTNTQ